MDRIVEPLELGDEPPSNDSRNPEFSAVVEQCADRRRFLSGGIAIAAAGVFGVSLRSADPSAAMEPGLLGFKAVSVSEADTVTVPQGYRVQVLTPWGESLDGEPRPFSLAATADEQARQIGSHHDGLHFFPIDGSATDGLLVMNHEYVDPRFLHAAYAGQSIAEGKVVLRDGRRVREEVVKEINAHGVSVVRVAKQSDGRWQVRADRRNRRITAATPMQIAGPVRGTAHVVTRFSPDGTAARGTLNNCANGFTPWNTYLTAEENWAGYFRCGDDPLPASHRRYGIRGGETRYGWDKVEGGGEEYTRFDATRSADNAAYDYRNEPHTFGWIVEIDPFNPDSVPVKRTHLGRFAHEGVVFAKLVSGKPIVCYSGDDSNNEYIYKFVSRQPYDAATASGALLDDGTLYVARFNADGSGEWLRLVPGENGLTAERGFATLADVLVNTRLAADVAGATKMDRPEWGAIDPRSGEVYFTLTNNMARKDGEVHPANPRAANAHGQIVRWTEAGGDHAATRFQWSLFVLAGDAAGSRNLNGQAMNDQSLFSCPDGLWFDPDGRLWIQTDIGESQQNRGVHKPFGNNAMLAADPRTGEIRRFLTGPVGQEITGLIMAPDQRTMFVNIQHPGATTSAADFAAGRFVSHWPDGGSAVPRSATLVITREDGGVIGT